MPEAKNDPTMLYRMPGEHYIHDGKYDYRIVPAAEVEAAEREGWHLTIVEARAAHEADEAAKAAKAAKRAKAEG